MPVPKNKYTAEDYWSLPEGTRAELIDGELWDFAAPNRVHQEILQALSMGIGNFIASHGGLCKVYPAPFAVNLFDDETTFVEPDISIICNRSKLSNRGCEGAPDMVIEIVSPSRTGMDYVTKLNLYKEAGVREYWICDPIKERTFVYAFNGDDISPTIYPFSAPVTSAIVLPGFAVDLRDILQTM